MTNNQISRFFVNAKDSVGPEISRDIEKSSLEGSFCNVAH